MKGRAIATLRMQNKKRNRHLKSEEWEGKDRHVETNAIVLFTPNHQSQLRCPHRMPSPFVKYTLL